MYADSRFVTLRPLRARLPTARRLFNCFPTPPIGQIVPNLDLVVNDACAQVDLASRICLVFSRVWFGKAFLQTLARLGVYQTLVDLFGCVFPPLTNDNKLLVGEVLPHDE